jgi:hypothetical protein
MTLLLGTSAAGSNLYKYEGVKKFSNPNRWEIPIATIKQRIDEIQRRVNKDFQYLEIMRQVVK